MSLKWTDVMDIAIELEEVHPDVDPVTVNFVDLMNWVMALPPGSRRRTSVPFLAQHAVRADCDSTMK